MKKEEFSFVKWLTTRDVEKIVDKLGLELMTSPDTGKKRISKYKDSETNNYCILAFCKHKEVENDETDSALKGISLSNNMKKLLVTMAATSFAFGGGAYSDCFDNVILRFEDFFLYEVLSLKFGDELEEFNRNAIKVYQNYMKEKFGTHYVHMKRAKYKKLYEEIRKDKENEQQNENEDDEKNENQEVK